MKIVLLLCLSVCFAAFTSAAPTQILFLIEKDMAEPDLKEYVGTYTFTGNSPITTFTITVEQDELFGKADSFEANKLIKQAKPDTFLSTSTYGSTIVFLRDKETKKVTGLQLIIQGTTLEATINK